MARKRTSNNITPDDLDFPLCCSKLYDFNCKEKAVSYYMMYMLNRLQSAFYYKGLPEEINKERYELFTQTTGYTGLVKHKDKYYCLYGSLGGELDAYYEPTKFIVANPALPDLPGEFTVGVDCVIIKNDSLRLGVLPMFSRYSTLLTENDISIRMADISTRMSLLLSAGDETAQRTAQDYIDNVESGKLGIIKDPAFMEELVGTKNLTSSRASNQDIINLIELEQYLKGSWFMELGIKAPFNMKREALGDSENGLQDASLLPLIDNMLACRKKAWEEEAKKVFGLEVTVELDSAWEDIQSEPEHQMEDNPDKDPEEPEDKPEEKEVEEPEEKEEKEPEEEEDKENEPE